MKKKERIIWVALVTLLLVVTTASALNNRIFAGDSEKTYESLRIFNEIFNLLRTEYYDEEKTLPEALTRGAINGMIESLDDPHTAYMTKEMFRDLQTETKGEFGGVGIVIGVRDKWITVIAPIDDTPGSRAGIKAGDRIIMIDGESTEGFTTMDAVNLIRGRVGTSVVLTIKREAVEKPMDFEIVRGIIQLESVKSETIDDHIGYVRITSFSEHTADALKEQLRTLIEKNVDSLIVDLRNNPGGLLSSAIEISDMFLDDGTIVSIKGRIKSQNQVYQAHEKTIAPDIPLIVLVNEGSASGSEIVAGAIKDNKRGILVGTKTFGKGSVQTVRELPDGSGIRITTALYYTPSGVSINKIGINPDEEVHEVEITEEESAAIEKVNELGLIKDFADTHEKYSDEDFEKLQEELSKNDIELKPVIIRRLIRNEHEKDRLPDLIDLDYDVQLKHSVDMINSKDLFTKAGASINAE